MKITTRHITETAIILAICIASQFLKNMNVYITGSIINACLIIATLGIGMGCALLLAIITPITSFLITGSPVMAAIPLLVPCIILGNMAYVICISKLNKINNKHLPINLIIGSCVKAAFMGILISEIILPNMIPEAMLPKLVALQIQFSLTQLITALIGSFFAYFIWIPLKKVMLFEK